MAEQQLASCVVMVSPDRFGFNAETAVSNPFAHQPENEAAIHDTVLREFRGMVATLRGQGVRVLCLPSRAGVETPDAVFPNNWFSHHSDGTLVLYPMLAPNRRAERQPVALKRVLATTQIIPPTVVRLTRNEQRGIILEGTGSLVLERVHRVAFAMESPRTNRALFDRWCRRFGYEGIFFHAYDAAAMPIYHTNVMMSIGREFAVVCDAAIIDPAERALVLGRLRDLGKAIVSISSEQMHHFCGNILQVLTIDGKPKIVLSQTAFQAFQPQQREQLAMYGELIPVAISTIERVGGGSARCMLAEVFL
jgi:hypothetical protein